MSVVVSCASARNLGPLKLDAVNGTPTGAARNQAEFGGRTYTTAWWTYCGLDGRISVNCTHLSSVKPMGTISYVYSTSPCARIATGTGICTILSGFGIFHAVAHFFAGGASLSEPAGEPPSTHAAIVA